LKKKIVKFLVGLISLIVVLLVGVFIAFQVSPRPGVYLISKAYVGPVKITDPQKYKISTEKISVLQDQHYTSEHQKNTFDVYYPKAAKQPVPTVIWVHGGGFVGGDKEGTKEFATNLAADTQVAVVSMNYELAPDLHYPGQVKQIDELSRYLIRNQAKYPMLDMKNVMFGGDSAGAQIALQYALVQTNSAYAKQIDMKQTFKPAELRGTISYCGPVDLKQTMNQKTDNRFLKFFVRTVGWALLGKKDWQNTPQLAEASLVDHLTSEFPPTYVTDGNAFSFQEQGIALNKKLKSLGVESQGLFFTDTKDQIVHEYQFNYDTKEAKECYEQTVSFVNKFKTL
jgi:acetyl esterase